MRDNRARNARIFDMRAAGKSFGQIARILGMSRSSVSGVCYQQAHKAPAEMSAPPRGRFMLFRQKPRPVIKPFQPESVAPITLSAVSWMGPNYQPKLAHRMEVFDYDTFLGAPSGSVAQDAGHDRRAQLDDGETGS